MRWKHECNDSADAYHIDQLSLCGVGLHVHRDRILQPVVRDTHSFYRGVMVAYDSRRMPDPSQLLLPATVHDLRAALQLQRQAGQEPVPELRVAIRLAATDARLRTLRPESMMIQLNSLLEEIAVDQTPRGPVPNRGMREWLVTACFRAYWEEVQ